MRSRLEPMKKVARMLRTHEELLLNWFRAKGEISAGTVEGLNNKIRVVTRRSYGFRPAPVKRWKSRCITHSDGFRNRNQPTDSAEEASHSGSFVGLPLTKEVILFPLLVIRRGVRNPILRSVRCGNLLSPNEPHFRHKPAHKHTNQAAEENLCHFL